MKIFKNRKKENELLGKALGAAVKEALELKAENRKLRDECGEQAARIRMLEGVRKSLEAEIESLKGELKVRSGEVVTLKDLVERQGEDLQAARDTLRRVKNVLR